MGTCANCKHWRPHAGSPTNMVCGRMPTTADAAGPTARPILDLTEGNDPGVAVRMATSKDYRCVLYEE